MEGVYIMGIIKVSKVNTFFIGVIMMAISLCFSSQAQAAQQGDFTYIVTDGKAPITRFENYSAENVVIPSTLGGAPVTSIGDSAFSGFRKPEKC